MLCGIEAPPSVLLCDALRSRIQALHEMVDGFNGLVAQPHLAAADEMRHRGDDLLIVLSHFAHRLYHIEALTHGFEPWERSPVQRVHACEAACSS